METSTQRDENIRDFISSISEQDQEYANALKINSRLFKDKTGIIATFSSWSGRRVQDARELSAFGIRDTEDYLARRSKGNKMLIPKERLAKLNSFKAEADARMIRSYTSVSFLPGVYAVPRDMAKEVRDELVQQGALHQEAARAYVMDRVGDSGETLYEIDQRRMIDIFTRECPELSRDFFRAQYPTPNELIAKFRARIFVVPIFSPSVGDSELNRAQAIAIAKEARILAQEVSLKLRAGIAECLQSFLTTLGGKDLGSKINPRTIRSVRGFFERLRTMNFIADPVLDNAITEVEEKFGQATSFTREELEGLGIREVVSTVVSLASDHASALRQVEDSLDAMLIDDWEETKFVPRQPAPHSSDDSDLDSMTA